jgi:hypothetical protein
VDRVRQSVAGRAFFIIVSFLFQVSIGKTARSSNTLLADAVKKPMFSEHGLSEDFNLKPNLYEECSNYRSKKKFNWLLNS